jgi:hypothetical protein
MSPASVLDRFLTLVTNPNADSQLGQPLWRYVRFSVFSAHIGPQLTLSISECYNEVLSTKAPPPAVYSDPSNARTCEDSLSRGLAA